MLTRTQSRARAFAFTWFVVVATAPDTARHYISKHINP